MFFFYGPFVTTVLDEYYSRFFKSYFTTNKVSDLLINSSPIGSYVNTCERIGDGYSKNLVFTIALAAVVTIALTGFAIFLYKKRPSEAAGKAMVIQVSNIFRRIYMKKIVSTDQIELMIWNIIIIQ